METKGMQGKSYHALIICKNEIQAKAKASGILVQLRNITWSETWTSPLVTVGTLRAFPQALEQRKSRVYEVITVALSP